MKKTAVVLFAAAFLTAVFADESQDMKPELKPYGFVKGDMYYAIGGVQSWKQSAITCASSATGLDTTATSFTAQHSRFGLKGSGAIGNVTMGGVVELDFFVIASNANANPRMRLAYAWCKPVKGLEIRAGQQWDLFSPLNPTTNNTNANLWYNGNYGFRRTQLTLQYGLNLGSVTPMLQVSGGEATKETSDLGIDNLSGIPMIQGRLSLAFLEKMQIGVATAYATYGVDRDYATNGVSVDLNLPFHDLFSLKGEYAYGNNLDNANLFTIGGSGDANNDISTSGFWVQAMSKPASFFNIVAGFADEMVLDLDEDDDAGKKESNMTFYGDLIFPIGKYFSLSAEYQLLRTAMVGIDDANIAHIIDIAGKVVF
jgi:hypothetical protein